MGFFDFMSDKPQTPDYSGVIAGLNTAAQTSADRGVFKPVTVSTSFGTPTYQYDAQGRLTSAGYEAAPWLQGLQQGQQNLAGTYLNAAQQAAANQQGLQSANQAYGASANLYGLAGQALPTSYDIGDKTQEYYNRMQQMVAPQREQQLASTRQSLFNKGRQGLAVGATQAGGQLATNPEMAAYYNAIAQQDLGLANQSEQQALANLTQQQGLGLGLLSAGLQQGVGGGQQQNQQYANWVASQQPLGTSLGQLGTMESMAQQPLQLGLQFGAPTTAGMQYGGNLLWDAAQNAARLQTGQINAETQSANTPTGWQALAGGAINSLANAGTNWLTGGGAKGLFDSAGNWLSSSSNPFSDAGSAMRSSGFGWTPSGYTMPQGQDW
mgnify:CR=1 FL=1